MHNISKTIENTASGKNYYKDRESIVNILKSNSIKATQLPNDLIENNDRVKIKDFTAKEILKYCALSTLITVPILFINPMISIAASPFASVTVSQSVLLAVSDIVLPILKTSAILFDTKALSKIISYLGSTKKSMYCTVYTKMTLKSLFSPTEYQLAIKDTNDTIKIVSVSQAIYNRVKENQNILVFSIDNKTIHAVNVS